MAINLPIGYDLGPAIRKQGVADALNALVGGVERGQRIGSAFISDELAIRDQIEQERAARRKEAGDEAALLEAAAWEAGTEEIGGPGYGLRAGGRRRGGLRGGYSQALSSGAPISIPVTGMTRAEAAEAMALQQQAAIEEHAANRAALEGERSRLQEALEQATAEQAPLDRSTEMTNLINRHEALTDYINRPAVFLPQSRLREGLAGTIDADVEMRGGTAGQHGGESGWWIRPEDAEEFLARPEGSVTAPLARGRANMKPPQEPAGPTPRPVSELEAALAAKRAEIEALPQPKPVSKNPFHVRFGKNKLPDPKAVATAVGLARKGDYGMINEIVGRPVKKSEVEGLYSDYEGYIVDVETFGRKEVASRREKALIEEEAKAQKANEANREKLFAGIKLSLGEGGRSGLTEEQISDLAGGIADTWLVDKALGQSQLNNLLKQGTEGRALAAQLAKESRMSRRKATAEIEKLYPGMNVKFYDAARAADAALDTWLGQLNKVSNAPAEGKTDQEIAILKAGVGPAFENYKLARDAFRAASGRLHRPKTDEELAALRVKRVEEMSKAIKSGKVAPDVVTKRAIARYGDTEGASIAAAAIELAGGAPEPAAGGEAEGGGAAEMSPRGGEPETPQGSSELDQRIRDVRGEGRGLSERAFNAMFTAKRRPLALLERDLEELERERKTPQLRDRPGLEKRIEDKIAEIEAWYASREGEELSDLIRAQRIRAQRPSSR